MSSPEAGPSSIPAPAPPLFKKRAKSTSASRISRAVIDDDPPSQSQTSTTSPDDQQSPDQPDTEQLSLQDLIALRSLARKPTGIELERLNKGEKKRKPKQSTQPQDKWEQHMKRGGLVTTAAEDDQDSDGEDEGKPRRLVRQNNFQGETGTVDVDKHMMAYIEQEMAKRTGNSAASTDSAAIEKALSNPEDQLYTLAEKYRQLQRSIKPEQTQEEREGNVAFSSAMLSSIPEVDLGIDARMNNIQATEEAKRRLASEKKADMGQDDAAYASARFQHAKPRANHLDSTPKGGGERKQLATDQLVLDRFKKRQKNFR